MYIKKLLVLVVFLTSSAAFAGGADDPLNFKIMINQLEYRDGDGQNPTVFEGEAWIGKDLNKLWIKADIERTGGNTEESELQLLYSRAIAPYWDFQAGFRRDIRPTPTRDWVALGFKGLAPYFFELDAAIFLGDNGRSAFRFEGEYEILFTQKLILTPEITVDFYGKSDPDTATGSGLSQVSTGLRLRYEIRRQFGPYMGVFWSKKYGETADFARIAGSEVSDTKFVLGLRAWF